MYFDVEKLACILNELIIAKNVYDLIKKGYNPSSLYRLLNMLIDYGFVNVVWINNVKYYHLTELGAEFLKILRQAIVSKLRKHFEKQGIKYKIWYGDNNTRAISPIIYVEKKVSLSSNIEKLVRIKVEAM